MDQTACTGWFEPSWRGSGRGERCSARLIRSRTIGTVDPRALPYQPQATVSWRRTGTPGTRPRTQETQTRFPPKPRHNGTPARQRDGATAPGSDDRIPGLRPLSKLPFPRKMAAVADTGESYAIGLYPRAAPAAAPPGVIPSRGVPSAKRRSGGDGAPAGPLLQCPAADAGAVLGRNRSRAGRRGHTAGAIT